MKENAARVRRLHAFDADDGLRKLKEGLSRFNLFEAVDLGRREVKHSAFLAYLLGPRNRHGLGAAFFLAWARDIWPDDPYFEGDWSDLIVERESDRIDLMISSSRHAFACAIENKIDAGEHGDQLSRYHVAATRKFAAARRREFIFLSPVGVRPTSENWTAVTYATVLRALDQVRGSNLAPDIALAIDHYRVLLRRHIVPDEKLVQECKAIYAKHKEAIDLIVEHAVTSESAEITDLVKRILDGVDTITPDISRPSIARYAVKAFDKVPQLRGGSHWPKTDRGLLLEFGIYNRGLWCELVIGARDEQTRNRLLSLLGTAGFAKRKDKISAWPRLYIEKITQWGDDKDMDSLQGDIEEFWRRFSETELPVLSRRVVELFPRGSRA